MHREQKTARLRAAALAILLVLAALPASSQAASAPLPSPADLAGDWMGALDAGGKKLPLVFHIQSTASGLSATWDSPSQGAKGLPAGKVLFADGKLSIDIPMLKGGYEGRLGADGAFEGTFKQGPATLPLRLEKNSAGSAQSALASPSAAEATPARPQTPKAPFPYTSLDVKIPGGAPGVTLAGSLVVPAGKGPFPAIVLVSGSGAQDRDETILGHKPFLVIADYLARRGVASLRYDDRGTAASTGDFGTATTMDFAADAQAALDWLAARKEVDARRVGLAGHSEGGLVAPIVAARDPKVRFIILLAGPGLSGEKILYLQSAAIARASGASEADIGEGNALNAKLYAAAMAPGSDAEAAARVKDAFTEAVKAEAGLSEAEMAEALTQADSLAASLTTPWMRGFLSLDPAPWLAKVAVPTLALNGSLDLQVPAEEDLGAIRKAFEGSGRAGLLTTRRFEGLNHLFQHAKTGLPSEYADITETFAPEALAALGDWILAR